jgi:Flp pilus assembly protein TadB
VIDPLDPLYRLDKSIQKSRFESGGEMSSAVFAIIICCIGAVAAGVITSIWDGLSMAATFGWVAGGIGLSYFFYSFTRMFFEATTGNSEAEANEGAVKLD